MKNLLLIIFLYGSLYAQTIEGTVVSSKGFWKDGNIYTKHIIETSKGKDSIITWGGVVGFDALVVSDMPTLRKGQKGKFYVKDGMLERIERPIQKALAVVSVSPTNIHAGVREVLTITGNGFGDRNIVQFAGADYGGSFFIDALDGQIISWTDTEIKVEVPSGAGTGIVKVVTLGGDVYESNPITVPYALSALPFDLGNGMIEYPAYHVDKNNNGGITWQYNTDVPQPARVDFEASLLNWSCNTLMNWEIGEDTTVNSVTDDGVNVVFFDDIGLSTLGYCFSRYSACYDGDTNSIIWYVKELDIVFSSQANWIYGDIAALKAISFKSVALHETGHGRQMYHVIDPAKVMHYSISSNSLKVVLSPADIEGGLRVQDGSTAGVCSQPLFTDYQCSLGVNDYDYGKLLDITYYDLLGRKVNIEYVSDGIYIKEMRYENGVERKKTIKQ